MAAPRVMSDAELFQMTGDWNAAAALRDQQNQALNEYNWSQSAPSNVLSGNILAGASWNSANTALQDALTQATGQQTSNYAVGGSTTADTLNQLNTFIDNGGSFDPNATVFLQAGGVDFIQGVDKDVVKNNLNQIVKTLGDQGVNVVLTGSPYAASVQDVISNNFNPEVDQIFKDVAKANSNVALVGTQGEILQNKKLLVDALHTNAEGTSIYNQSVIDALSQFKNEVPFSTPQAIAQVQKTSAIPTARGTVIEGDNIDQQIANLPELMYQTRTNPNNPAIWETYNPKTGEIIDTGTFAGGGDQGLLAASRPVLALAASVLGAPYLSDLIAGSTGLSGSALSGATGATIAGGSTALTGGSAEDTLKAALLAGGGAYLGSELQNALYDSTAAADTAAGLTPKYGTTYDEILANLMDSPEAQQAMQDLISGNVSAPIVDTSTADNLVITAPTSSVNVADALTPTLTVTGARPVTQQNVIDTIAATGATIPEVKVVSQRPVNSATVEDVLSTITAPAISIPATTATTATTPAKTTTTASTKETDPLKVAQLALSAAGLLGAGAALSNTNTPTGFEVVPIPEGWKTPPPTGVAPFTQLPPIDFGNRNLLIGTQWEKFLDPNYGKVPAPVQYSQPSNLSYSDLMGILGSKQGMPSASSLSINDIISGIQNQYGQAPARTMG